jgi:hypothetical protein
MANALYDAARESGLKAGQKLDTDSIKVILIDAADYTVNLATHDFLDDIPSAARVATSAALGSKTTAAGVFDAADTLFASATGDPSEALVIYNDTPGTEATKPLLAYIDTATGLPVTPNGGDINVAWDNGSNKIYKL